MLPKALEQIARDVESDRETSSRLKKALGTTEKAISRAQRLELITRILDHACSSHSEAAESAGRVALASLRTLTPFLKKQSTSSVDTIASIEKYAVNFALSTSSRSGKPPSAPSRESELITSLQRIFSARVDDKKVRNENRALTRKRNTKPDVDKENDDPDQHLKSSVAVNSKLVDLLFFPCAAKLGLARLLPHQDSVGVASIVAGALVIRFTRCCSALRLKDVLALVEHAVLPWLGYLKSFSDEKSQRIYDAYAKRLSCFLFDLCKKPQSDLATVLSVRLFALQLEHPKLNKFARDLLQSVNNFVRRQNPGKNLSRQLCEAIYPVYEKALRYAAKYDSSDRRWISEDVSAWLDHLASVWARGKLSRSIPSVFDLRLSTFRNQKDLNPLLECFKLQKDLFDAGAYQLDAETLDKQKSLRYNHMLWEKTSILLKSFNLEDLLDAEERSLFSAQSSEFRGDWKSASFDGLRCLRLSRILEPLRRYIAATSSESSLPQGAEIVLRMYMTVLFRGLSVLSWPDRTSYPENASEIAEIELRLNKMVGGGIEAARDLIRLYSHQHQFEALEDVTFVAAKILHHHSKHSSAASWTWKEWVYGVLTSTSKNILAKLTVNDAEEEILASRLYQTLVLCTEELLKLAADTEVTSKGYINILSMLRDAMLCRKWWSEAAEVSLRMFEHVMKATSQQQHQIVTSEVSRMISQDIVRLSRSGDDLSFFEDLTIPADRILAAFVEYSCWARKHRDSFKTLPKYLKTVDALVLMRKSVFEHCEMTGLLCPVRRAHEQWLAFDRSLTSKTANKKKKMWKSAKPEPCPGHCSVHMVHPQGVEVTCMALHKRFLADLKDACEAAASRTFDRISEVFSALETSLENDKQLTSHVELMTLSVEAFEWISTVLSYNSFGGLANRALTLAHECGSLLDTSASLRESLKVCSLLDSLPTLDICEVQEEESINSKILQTREARNQFKLPCTLHGAMSDVKSSLRTLSKFEIGCQEGPAQSFSIGGIAVDFGFDNNSMSGHHRHGLVLELVQRIFYLGTVQLQIENMADARYYLELCWRIASACLPTKNNSFRRIASLSQARCLTKRSASTAIQNSILKQVPGDEEDLEEGRSFISTLSTLQATAGAMLYVEMVCLEATNLAVTDSSHVDLIIALYERCQRMLEADRCTTNLFSNLPAEVSHVDFHLGLAYLLKGEESAVVDLMKPLSETDIEDDQIRANACYELAKLYIRQGSGLRSCVEKSTCKVPSQEESLPTRGRRGRSRRANLAKCRASIDEIRTVLKHGTQRLSPCLGNFPLYRKVLNLAAMVESEPELMAWRLETTVGLSFNARYEHNMRSKPQRGIRKVQRRSNSDDVGDLEKRLQMISLDTAERSEKPSCMTRITKAIATLKSVLVGIHIDEGKNNLVVWRRCAHGFHIRRLWLSSSGPHSYQGVLGRMEAILDQMKRSSYREGERWSNAEKASWWKERHSLDMEMRKVLTDVQEVWLGAAINLLIPSVVSESGRDKHKQTLLFEDYVELGERARRASDDEVEFGQLILLVDTPCERIPWESLPLLRENDVGATRTPSTKFLDALWNSEKVFDYKSMFYILNPEGNLHKTEGRFREKLESQSSWSGIVGRTSSEEVLSSYDGEEIFLFCGHGAGENFFSPTTLCTRTEAPIALLMGCSSCKPKDIEVGDFESNGPAIDFLVHGSPAVVGNLWDVSDGEIDRLTASTLALWLGDDQEDLQGVSLADAVAQSRSTCRLPYLVGAACIVVGVPHIYVQNT